MRLNDTFWKQYELDLQEVKVAYLNWALSYAKEPNRNHRHLFLWDHQDRVLSGRQQIWPRLWDESFWRWCKRCAQVGKAIVVSREY